MDLKTESIWLEEGLLKNEIREKILHRCEILRYMGDDGISYIFDQLPDHELVEDCGWVLDKAHDDLDNFQLGLTRKIINKGAVRRSNQNIQESLPHEKVAKDFYNSDMWS